MNESLTARNSLSDQQIKNLRKREQRKVLQLQLMERNESVMAMASREAVRRNRENAPLRA